MSVPVHGTIISFWLLSLFDQKAECDLEGAIEDEDGKENTTVGNFVPIRADHITKIAAELLMDFS